MDALAFVIIAVLVIAGLVAFDLLALRYGADSRPMLGDDHARSVGF